MAAMSELPEHVRRNREAWDCYAAEYVEPGRRNWAADEPTWGIWGVPEADVGMLPDDLAACDAIELGCGTAYVSAWLARRGARPVGIDNSQAQLASARALQAEFGLEFPLLHGNAEAVPYPDAQLRPRDLRVRRGLWCDPYGWIPEAARLLRPGGRLRFLTNGALMAICLPDEDGVPADERLVRPYFGMHRFEWPDDDSVEFHLPHGEMIRAPARHRLRGRGPRGGPAPGRRHHALPVRHAGLGAPVALRGGLAGAQARVTRNHSAGAYVDSGKVRLVLLALAAGLAGCGGAEAETADGAVRLQKVGHFDSPVYVTAPPGDTHRVFVVEQGGTIRVVRDGKTLATPFLDIRSLVSSGRRAGLLSLAFAPDYARSGRFYVDYTDTQRRHADRRVPARRRADVADPGSARQVLFQPQPEPNHNGGLLLFGPDKLLYVGFGDGGGGGDQHGAHGNAQNLGTLLGQDPAHRPARERAGGRTRSRRRTRSSAGAGRAARSTPTGCATRGGSRSTARTGDLSIGDVGQDAVEEIDFVRARPRARQELRLAGVRGPLALQRRASRAPGRGRPGDHRAPLGRQLLDHRRRRRARPARCAAWRGRYVFGDFCQGVHRSRAGCGRAQRRARAPTRLKVPGLSSFGEDARGRVYAVVAGRAGLPSRAAVTLGRLRHRPRARRRTRAR